MIGRAGRARWPFGRRAGVGRAAPVGAIAGEVQRLAVLLAAGVPPVAAWGYLRPAPLISRVCALAGRGTSIPDAISEAIAALTAPADPPPAPPEVETRARWKLPARFASSARAASHARSASPALSPDEATAWRGVATAWAVATEAGAPLAPTLRDFAGALRSLAQAQREIRVALAEPASTARMVMALPALGVFFGLALGFNTIATLTTPFGLACLAVGAVLLAAAARWNRALVHSARPRELTPGLQFDLTAIAVSGGAALDRACASVDRAMASHGFAPSAETQQAVEEVLDLSRRAGVPAAELLRSEAEETRRAARAEMQERASSLSVALMLPLGLCVLPAFMAVGVLPLLATIVTSTVTGV